MKEKNKFTRCSKFVILDPRIINYSFIILGSRIINDDRPKL